MKARWQKRHLMFCITNATEPLAVYTDQNNPDVQETLRDIRAANLTVKILKEAYKTSWTGLIFMEKYSFLYEGFNAKIGRLHSFGLINYWIRKYSFTYDFEEPDEPIHLT